MNQTERAAHDLRSPVTSKRVEAALNKVALIMEFDLAVLPVYRALQDDLAVIQAAEAAAQEARDRARRVRNNLRVGSGSGSKALRFSVLSRDGFRCRYCGATPDATELHVDHVIPKSRGGSDELDNLVCSCAACNLGKSDRPFEPGSVPS